MKKIIAPLGSVLAGVLGGLPVAFLQYRHLRERVNYDERKVDRLNRRLWMENDHP